MPNITTNHAITYTNNARAQNKIARAHTYRYTTEIKIQVINKQCKDTMVQFKPTCIMTQLPT